MKLKRMRFNLRFPDPRGSGNFVTIHSVKELQDCLVDRTIAFDVLIDYFKNGQLHRWLECLDAAESSRSETIKKLFAESQGRSVADFAASLLNALDIEVDEEVVNAFVLDYVTNPEKMLQDKMRVLKDFDAYKTKTSGLIEGFRKDKSRLLELKENLKALRKYIAGMLKVYGGFSMLDEFCFMEFLKSECPLGVLALLTLPEGQKYKDKSPELFKRFLTVKLLNSEPTIFLNESIKLEKVHPYFLSGDDAPIKIYRKATNRNSWEPIVQGGKKVLLIWMREYVVTDYGEDDQFSCDKVNGSFHIFNGLEVWSECGKFAFPRPFLVYIEVPNDVE